MDKKSIETIEPTILYKRKSPPEAPEIQPTKHQKVELGPPYVGPEAEAAEILRRSVEEMNQPDSIQTFHNPNYSTTNKQTKKENKKKKKAKKWKQKKAQQATEPCRFFFEGKCNKVRNKLCNGHQY